MNNVSNIDNSLSKSPWIPFKIFSNPFTYFTKKLTFTYSISLKLTLIIYMRSRYLFVLNIYVFPISSNIY